MGTPIGPDPSKTPALKPGSVPPKQVNNQNGDNGQRGAVNVDGSGNLTQVVNVNVAPAAPGTTTTTRVRVSAGTDQLVRNSEDHPCVEKRQYTPANATDLGVIEEEKKISGCATRQKRLAGDHPCGYDGIKRMDAARQAWRAQNAGTTTNVESNDALLAKANSAASINGPALSAAGFGDGATDPKLQGLRNIFHQFWNNDGNCIKFIDMKSEIPAIFAFAKANGISSEDVGKVFLQSVKEDTKFSTALMARQWAQLAGSSAFKGKAGEEFGASFNTFGKVIANGAIADGGLKPGQVVASFEGKAENASFDNILITVGADGQANIQGLSTNADALKLSGRIFYNFDANAATSDVSSSATGRTGGAFGEGSVTATGQGAPVNKADLSARIIKFREGNTHIRDFTPSLQTFSGVSSFDTLESLTALRDELSGLKGSFSGNQSALSQIDSILQDLGRLIAEKSGAKPSAPAATGTPAAAGTPAATGAPAATGTPPVAGTPPAAKPESSEGKAILSLVDQIFNKDLLGVTTGNTAEIRGKIITGAGESIDKLDGKALGELSKNIEAYRAEAKNQGVSISDSTNKKLDDLSKLVRNRLTDVQLGSVKDLLVIGAQGTDNAGAPALSGFSSVGGLDSKGLEALKSEVSSFRGKGYTSPEQEKIIDSILFKLENLISEKKEQESIENRKSLESELGSLKKDEGFQLQLGESNKTSPLLNNFSSLQGQTIPKLQSLKSELAGLKTGDFMDTSTKSKIDSILAKLTTVIAEEKEKASKSTFQADTDHGLSQKFYDAAENGVKLLPPSLDDIKKDIGKAKGSFDSSFGDTESSVLNRWDDATKAKTLRFIAQYATNIAEAMKQSGANPAEIKAYADKASALNAQADKLEGRTSPPPPGAFSPT